MLALGPSVHTAKETYQNIFGRTMVNTWKAIASNENTIKNQKKANQTQKHCIFCQAFEQYW